MLRKIRHAMATRNAKYQLVGLVQIDDAFFGGKSHGDGKQGRGTDQESVVVAVELKKGHPGHAFLALVPDLSKDSIEPILETR